MFAYTLRNCTVDDAEFLYRVAEVNFRPLVEGIGRKWATELMRGKFRQDAGSANTSIIQVEHRDIGFLKVDMEDAMINLDSLLLMPEYQRRGLGTQILLSIVERSKALAHPIRLNVYHANPAREFWLKHGFIAVSELHQHVQMERVPGSL